MTLETLLADPDLGGGGWQYITRGGYLDVPIDFNLHPKTKPHRRLDLLLYRNASWRDDYEGHLELWDLTSDRRPKRRERVALACPPGVTRKSIAIHCYAATRDDLGEAAEHNTVYRQTS